MVRLVQPARRDEIKARSRRSHLAWQMLLVCFAGSILLTIAGYFLIVWPWLSSWGATRAEINRELPGDDLIAAPAFVTTKAVTIQARPEQIWPWLMQLGVDRGGMYSYLWVENWLLQLDVENSDVIRPEWQQLQVGDFIRFTPKDFASNPGPGLYVITIEPNHALVGCFGMEDRATNCNESATWQFVLEPQADNTTRFLLRSRTSGVPHSMAAAGKIAAAFQFYMERKMLLGIQARAEMSTENSTLSVDATGAR